MTLYLCFAKPVQMPQEALHACCGNGRCHLIKPALLIYVLPHELYGGLGIVLVHQGHIDVIHKVHQAL